jgi:hypothetical protein
VIHGLQKENKMTSKITITITSTTDGFIVDKSIDAKEADQVEKVLATLIYNIIYKFVDLIGTAKKDITEEVK